MAGRGASKNSRPRRGKKKAKKYPGCERNQGPARARYWASGRLRERKVRAMMQHSGMSRTAAENQWDLTRTHVRTAPVLRGR